MLNLLFISDSPKTEYVKGVLQPVLKVIIDVVTDFDHGMKNVFEKRPATVCIQDKIGGVTGESVARHIQMLLGNSAPEFILLHSGNGKVRATKGLFEHIVDLSQPQEALAEEIISTLKSLLGDQWEKICLPPKSTAVSAGPVAPEGSHQDADSPVNDILPDLEMSTFPVEFHQPTESARKPENDPETAEPVTLAKSAVTASLKRDAKSTSEPVIQPQKRQAPVTPPAAEFKIRHNLPPVEEQVPEDLLQAFEENYRSKSQFLRRSAAIALVGVVCAAGGWYFSTHKPQLLSSLKQPNVALKGEKQAPVTSPAVVPEQKPVSPPDLQPVVSPSLPTFIPKDGRDASYAIKNPGWERYVGKSGEYRVFSTSGRIQAVQVLAIKEAPVSESLLKSVLQELVGSPEYQAISQSTKAGVKIENGRINYKGEVVIYRKNGALRAFVVSVN